MNIIDNCAICRAPMRRNAIIRFHPCRHIFHQRCVARLGNEPGVFCPLCRTLVTDQEPIVRKTYNKYGKQDRERIVTCANRGEDWVALASALQVNYKTAFTWITSGRPENLKKGGLKPKSLTEDETELIIEWVEEDCGITLKQIKEKILRDFNKVIAISTIGNYLEGRLFTIKNTHKELSTMNSPENKRKRAEYVEQLNRYIEQGKQILWIDETNFNLFCRRTRGRSRKGARAVQLLPAARGPNVHLIGGITSAGVVLMQRKRGSYTAVLANTWLEELLHRWEELGNELLDLVIVCDNAPCHSRLEEVVNGTEARLLRLGPYSPMLNPIENIWSKIKTYCKTHLRVPDVQPPGVVEQRLTYLERIIDEAKDTVVGGDCSRAAQHTTIHHVAALAMQDMRVGR